MLVATVYQILDNFDKMKKKLERHKLLKLLEENRKSK